MLNWPFFYHCRNYEALMSLQEIHAQEDICLIQLGNDDDVPGAPACFAVIPLALVTLNKGIDLILY